MHLTGFALEHKIPFELSMDMLVTTLEMKWKEQRLAPSPVFYDKLRCMVHGTTLIYSPL